ncbi:hypothetical protein GBP19_04160 [Pediococcus acidilactici]|uniref:hypothetical protein n=1 Tax=Pediococcus acidilactici TaxID=1254 RepID=UPI00094773AA|nr:hypothetical protein [Pediococcus acidilactici]APR28047.1 hypothetical protein BTW26_03135 [Pediococcus acidilactici]APR28100.1 hypothetical protein BTW26_03410 [Pediococcus acidilactici]KAF0500098.1 hypothetical protein GBP19_04160 [Pediococcus acidilactici]
MKLVKIDDYTYANPALIGAIECGRFGTDIYLAGSNKPIETLAKIGKVLDTLCGSEEHSVEYEDDENYRRDNNYSIFIGNDNAGSKMIGTRSKVLNLLDQLKNDETLTIKRTK